MLITPLLKLAVEKLASDIFISAGAPINIKVNGVTMPVNAQRIDVATVERIAYELMTPGQAKILEDALYHCSINMEEPLKEKITWDGFETFGSVAMKIRSSLYIYGTNVGFFDNDKLILKDNDLEPILKPLLGDKWQIINF